MRANLRRAYEARRAAVRDRGAEEIPTLVVDDLPAGVTVVAPAEPGGTVVVPPPSTSSLDDHDVPRSLRVAAAWGWRLIVLGVVTVALLWLMNKFLILVAPLMIGLLLTSLLTPALSRLLRLRLNRTVATTVVLVTGLAAVSGTLTLVINSFIAGLPELTESAAEAIRQMQQWLRTGPLTLSDAQIENLIDEGEQWVAENQAALTSNAFSAVGSVVQVITGMVLAFVATFFFLRDGRRIWTFLVGMLPVPAREPLNRAGVASWATLASYVRATVLVASIDAVGIGLGLWILRVPLVLPLAALIFLASFVPLVGAFISGFLAVAVAFVDDGIVKALLVLGVVLLVQQIEGNVLQPVIMSRAVSIHPLAVVIGITAGAVLAGIIGALVAVPVIAVINTAIRRLYESRARRPALEAGPAPAD
jgi:predicted PurR-regulated permease PerM